MITLGIVIAALAALGIVQNLHVSELQKQNAQLYADNQALMTALANANGQQLHFETMAEKSSEPKPRRRTPAPYWKSKETADIQIGNKTVTVTKQSI